MANGMNQIIRNHAEAMDYEITDYDIEKIKQKYFQAFAPASLREHCWDQRIKQVIQDYFL